jgi:hypothetical protein
MFWQTCTIRHFKRVFCVELSLEINRGWQINVKEYPYLPHIQQTSFSDCLYLQLFVCLIYIICVSLRIVVSNTYCVVFLFCFSSSCLPYVARFSGLPILISPLVFFNVYLEVCWICGNYVWMKDQIYLWFFFYNNFIARLIVFYFEILDEL